MIRIQLSLVGKGIEGPYRCVKCHNRYKQAPYAVDNEANYWCVSCALTQGYIPKQKRKARKKSKQKASQKANFQKDNTKSKISKSVAKPFESIYAQCAHCKALIYPKNRLRFHTCEEAELQASKEVAKVTQGEFLQSKIATAKRHQLQAKSHQPSYYDPKTIKQCRFCLERMPNRLLSKHIDYCTSNPSNHT